MDDTEFLFELSRVESKLMGYAMALTQYCTDDAQELFQATVVRAYIKRTLFIPGTRFYSWIERIMKNIYLNGCVDAQRNMALENVRNYDCALFSSCTDNRLEFNEVCTLIGRLPSEVALPLRIFKEYMPRYGYKHLCTEDDDYKYY